MHSSFRWRDLWEDAAGRLGSRMDARRIVEEASGLEGSAWPLVLDQPAPPAGVSRAEAMVERRASGEPLQYVIGMWGFRSLDLLVDQRVLIPRPETEGLVEAALQELERVGSLDGGSIVVDLGTGSGAIALSIAEEEPSAEVWGVDVSGAALDVARANLARMRCSSARRVRLAQGEWFSALPPDLRGRIGVAVSNPPYVAEHEHPSLPPEVGRWEPRGALVAGPEGTEALSRILDEAPSWLGRPGAAVLETAPHRAAEAVETAWAAGFTQVEILPDLCGRARVLVARI